ncbi:hypothetical protein E4T44_03164 [Aureobasidium sp. EXF-8845]|nr:hypothetical protein E4T44_03164 [Aureobasidium sp. EXF-8845]KAI4857044.1 hypothetical protein E4T45_01473 [Aureobasidium sp. EXF-8846]
MASKIQIHPVAINVWPRNTTLILAKSRQSPVVNATTCENCRLRKIKCDKQTPCASCQTLGITCQAAATRAAEHRPRIVVTSQYERQITLIQERLQGIESSLKHLTRGPVVSTPISKPEVNHPSTHSDRSISIFEGESSFGSQTIQAGQLANVTATTVAGVPSSELSSALSLLKDSLKRHEALSRTHETHLSTRIKLNIVDQQELPPAPLVIALIKTAKARPSISLVAFSFKGVEVLETLCQKVYFPLEPPPVGSMTFFYGFLYFVIRDYWSQQDPALREYDAQAVIDLCEARFCAGLEKFETLTVPVMPNIQALLLGAIKAQEECKLSLSWTFLSAAATMCHTLGFHRKSSLAHEDQESADIKRHLFWQLYMLDKNLSLNLGRGSNFPDSDIDAEFFTPSSNPAQRPWDIMSLATILFARLQGQVYDKLYSASAIESSPEERNRVVDELSSQVNALRNQLLSIDFSGAYYQERLIGMSHSADFVCYSVLTVIYRAQPSTSSTTEISPRCYEAARLGLENHLRCFAQFRNRSVPQQAEYVNWILLYPSFTPFTVVFIHAIATSNTTELDLLQETVHSLDHIKSLSPAAKRLHDVCAAFAKVAAAFITSQRTLSGWHCRVDGTLSLVSSETNYENDLAAVGQDQDALSAFLCSLAGQHRPLTDYLHMDLFDAELGLGDMFPST